MYSQNNCLCEQRMEDKITDGDEFLNVRISQMFLWMFFFMMWIFIFQLLTIMNK